MGCWQYSLHGMARLLMVIALLPVDLLLSALRLRSCVEWVGLDISSILHAVASVSLASAADSLCCRGCVCCICPLTA
jgi:hypothetical protein